MALGFIKKIFSFGKNKVEEVPAEGEPPAELEQAETAQPAPETAVEAPPEPAPEAPAEPEPELPEAVEEPAAVAPESVPETPDIEEPVAEKRAEPATEKPAEPEPRKPEIVPEEKESEPEEPTAEEPEAAADEEQERPEPAAIEEPVAESAAPEPVISADVTPETVTEPEPEAPAAEEGEPEGLEAEPEPDSEEPEEIEAAAASEAEETRPNEVEPPVVEPTEPTAARPQGKVTVSKSVEQAKAPEPEPEAPEPRKSWLQRLRAGLARSSRDLSGNIAAVFTKRKLDDDTLQDLEDVLIQADLGVETAMRVTDALAASRYGKDVSGEEVRGIMAAEVEKVLTPVALPLELDLSHKPHVILVVGVNGTGKTTTIGKLAAKLAQGGLSVMLAAGDTFRAAAIEQLHIWGERVGAPVISSKLGADAAGLAWDAYEKAKDAGSDVLIIDTAGRLQNKAELMDELAKIVRVLGKLDPEAPHTVLQTLDATTGQNALNQVEIFRNIAGVNGLVMTKLDGTARGGILVSIAAKHKLPVYFIGVGEQVDDLEPFSAADFASAIAGTGEFAA